MTTLLKNQPGIAVGSAPVAKPAQASPPLRAVSARNDLIAKPQLTPYGELDKQAKNLVGQTFYGTLLKQMRDDPFKSDLFDGGKGGKAFTEMFDQHLAQRMAQKSSGKLTRPLIKKFKAAADAAYEKQNRKKSTFSKENEYVPHDRRA